MSMTIRHQPMSSTIVPVPSTSTPTQQQPGRSRQGSTEIDDDGCCLVKIFISNMLTFTTRCISLSNASAITCPTFLSLLGFVNSIRRQVLVCLFFLMQ
uniref:Uncharacterized protein n=1 Tax=Panagrellus redivivus TaxID=6233 RepID=A0A7E4W875_PANRE